MSASVGYPKDVGSECLYEKECLEARLLGGGIPQIDEEPTSLREVQMLV